MARASLRRVAALLALALVLVPAFARAKDADAVGRMDGLVRTAEESYRAIRSYTCTILLREQHGGKLRALETIACKFRKPHSVALEWLPPGPYQGLRVSYVNSRDAEGTFLGREAGFAGLVGAKRYRFAGRFVQTFYPHHYSPAQTNLGFIIDLAATLYRKAVALGKFRVASQGRATSPYLKGETDRVEAVLSPDPADGLGYKRAVLYFDRATRLPLHLELYDFEDRLDGLYVFADFAPGVEIPDSAFDLK